VKIFKCTFAFGKPKGNSGNNNTGWQQDCQNRLSGVSMDSICVALSSFFYVFIDTAKIIIKLIV